VIERLLQGVLPGWRLVALKGNHDAMMVDALSIFSWSRGRRQGANHHGIFGHADSTC
jgi:hypothetical protein